MTFKPDPAKLLRDLEAWADERMANDQRSREALRKAIETGGLSIVIEGLPKPVENLPPDEAVQVGIDREGRIEWVSVPREAA